MTEKVKLKWKVWLKRFLLTGLGFFLLGIVLLAYAYYSASWASRGKLFDDVSKLPAVQDL